MLKIINGNPRTMFSCFFYLSDCSDVSIVDLEQVVADWDFLRVLNFVVSSKGLRQIRLANGIVNLAIQDLFCLALGKKVKTEACACL